MIKWGEQQQQSWHQRPRKKRLLRLGQWGAHQGRGQKWGTKGGRDSVWSTEHHGKPWRSWCCPDGSIWSPDKAGKHETLPSLFLLSSVINTCTFVYQTVTKKNSQKGTQCLGKNIFSPHFMFLALVICIDYLSTTLLPPQTPNDQASLLRDYFHTWKKWYASHQYSCFSFLKRQVSNMQFTYMTFLH